MSDQETAKVYADNVRALLEQVGQIVDQAKGVDKMLITFNVAPGADGRSVVTVGVIKQIPLV